MSDFSIEFEENDQQIKLEFEQAGGGAVKSVNGKTGVVVLDADDVGAYTKPSGGIPKTDLASAVQTSLGKADSAYQKPSGGIPAGDIASGVVPAVDNTLAISGAAADAKKTGDEISDLKDGLQVVETQITATLITDTASGAIASFPDGAAMPVKSLTVAVEPVQDLHGQANPWPAGGSKNKLVYPYRYSTSQTSNGVTFTANSDGSITANGTATANAVYTFHSSMNLADGTYILSGGKSAYKYLGLGYYNSDSATTETRVNNNTTGGATFTAHKGTVTYIQLIINNGQSCSNEVFYPMIRPSSVSDESFAPYSNICPISGHTSAVVTVSPTTDAQDGTSYTIDLDGTRYGGTLDVTTGVLTVTDANIASYNGETLPSTWISDRDVYASGTTPTTGAQVVYKLAEPFTVQLTAQEVSTLLGQNNIWADCGDVTAEYRADTKLYIEKLTAPTEDDMIADHAISANTFFMVGNTLYRATTAIASGATITVGTNATKMSLSEALNTLS